MVVSQIEQNYESGHDQWLLLGLYFGVQLWATTIIDLGNLQRT